MLPRLFAQAARTKSPELFLAISLLVVIVASLATTAAGLSPIVGALLAGLLIAETEYHSEVEVITAPFKGLALGVFLITVGHEPQPRDVARRIGPISCWRSPAWSRSRRWSRSALLRLSGARTASRRKPAC